MAELLVLYLGGDVWGELSSVPSGSAPMPPKHGIVVVQDVVTDSVLWVYGKRERSADEETYYGRGHYWFDLSTILTRRMLNAVGKLVVEDPSTISLGTLRLPSSTIPSDTYTAGKIEFAAIALVRSLVPGESH